MRITIITILLAVITGSVMTGGVQVFHPTNYQRKPQLSANTQAKYNLRTIQNSVTEVRVTPTPTAVVAPIAEAAPVTYEDPSSSVVEQYIYDVFGYGWQGQVAQCIAFHESGYRANAINYNWNGSIDRGVFQINSVHGYDPTTLFNYQSNIDIAYQMSGGGNNWGPWTTKKYCI